MRRFLLFSTFCCLLNTLTIVLAQDSMSDEETKLLGLILAEYCQGGCDIAVQGHTVIPPLLELAGTPSDKYFQNWAATKRQRLQELLGATDDHQRSGILGVPDAVLALAWRYVPDGPVNTVVIRDTPDITPGVIRHLHRHFAPRGQPLE